MRPGTANAGFGRREFSPQERDFSLSQQLEEVRREIAHRKNLYPKWVDNGKMKAKHAEYFLGRMLAVERTIAGLMADKRENP
jgi:hypothetical protein